MSEKRLWPGLRISSRGRTQSSRNLVVPVLDARQVRQLDEAVQYVIVRAIDFPSTEDIELFAQEVIPRLSLPR
jgi:hypothetical protein